MKKFTSTGIIFLFCAVNMVRAQVIEFVGTKFADSPNFPQPNAQQYSYTQCMYEPSDLAGDTIHGLQYHFKSGNLNNSTSWEIYLGETGQDGFTPGLYTDYIRNLTKVFDGQVAASGTTVTIFFDTPFIYSGNQNLVVAVNEKTPGQGGPRWWQSQADGNFCMYSVSNNSSFSGVNLPNGGGHNGNYRPYTGFITSEKCLEPTNVTVTDATASTAKVSFDGLNGQNWTINYQPVGGAAKSTAVNDTVDNLISDLDRYSVYNLTVTASCGASGTGLPSESVSFRTWACDDAPTLSIEEEFDNGNQLFYDCWVGLDKNGLGNRVYPASNIYHSAPKSVSFNVSNHNESYMILPIIENIQGGVLTFWAYKASAVEIGTMTNNYQIGTFTSFETVTNGEEWVQHTIDFSEYYGDDRYIAIKVKNSFCYIDDLTFNGQELPSDFVQDFEGWGAGPWQDREGWTAYNSISNQSSYGLEFDHSPANSVNGGSRSLYVSAFDEVDRYIISPRLKEITGRFSFWIKDFNGGEMVVGTVPSKDYADRINFTPLDTFDTFSPEYQRYVADLSAYTGDDQYLMIKFPLVQSGGGFLLDYLGYNQADTTLTDTLCYGESYLFDGIARTETGNYFDTIPRQGQLDSIVELDLTVLEMLTDTVAISECSTYESPSKKYNWNTSGQYVDTVTSVSGCDSIVVINLEILIEPMTFNVPSTELCAGEELAIGIPQGQVGVYYSLRDMDADTALTGSYMGGESFNLTIPEVSSSMNIGVWAERAQAASDSSAMDFNGTNEYMLIPNPNGLNLGATFTIEFWVYQRSTNYDRFVSNFDGAGGAISGEMIIDSYHASANGTSVRWVIREGATTKTMYAQGAFTPNQWQHVACVFDNGQMTIYVDGVSVNSEAAGFQSFTNVGFDWGIGEDRTPGAAEYLNGKMDEVRFWNTARTAQEIAAFKDQCLTGAETGLAIYYDFENAVADGGIKDRTSNGNDPELKNMLVEENMTDGVFACTEASCELMLGDTIALEVTTIDLTIEENPQGTLKAVAGADVYQWLDCLDNSPIQGEDDVQFNPLATGRYAAEITMGGCVDTTDCIDFTLVGQADLTDVQLKVYPNPVTTSLRVQIDQDVERLEVFTTAGLKVAEGYGTEVSVRDLAEGFYFVRVITQEGIYTQQFLKQ